MRGVRRNGTLLWILLASATSLLTAAARSQQPAADSAAPSVQRPLRGPGFGPGPFGERMELLGFGGMHGGKVVTGAPFSAVATVETKQTLADGTTISRKIQSNLFRDAQGRIRREVTTAAMGPVAANGGPRSFVFIQDPVLGVGYMLDPDKKIARKMPQHGNRGPAENSGAAAQGSRRNSDDDPNLKKDSLGTQTINGLSAQGTRYTRTIPAGQIGNDKPLTIVKEEWYSPDLQMLVQSRHSDPFMGDTTYTVAIIQRAAPNANLFSVPSDYSVEEGPAGGRGGKRHGHRAGGVPPVPADAPGPGM